MCEEIQNATCMCHQRIDHPNAEGGAYRCLRNYDEVSDEKLHDPYQGVAGVYVEFLLSHAEHPHCTDSRGEAHQVEIEWADDGDRHHPKMYLGGGAGALLRGSPVHVVHTLDVVGAESMCAEESAREEGAPLDETTTHVSLEMPGMIRSQCTMLASESQLSPPLDRPGTALVWNESDGESGRC